MKVIDSLWFSYLNDCIGIVIVEEDVAHEHKAFIGIGKGDDENVDAEKIAERGSPFPLKTVKWLESQLRPGKK